MEEKQELRRKRKNRVVGTAAGAFTAAALAVGALFGSPAEILQIDNDDGDDTEAAVSAVSVGKRLERAAGEGLRPRAGDSLRVFFLRRNAVVRGVVLLPMWCVGKVMLTALSLVFSALAPVWQIVLGVLLNAALLFGLFALVYKLLFPKAKLKNLFRKRNLLAFAIGSLALAVADALLRAYCAEYTPISIGIKIGVAAIVLTLLCLRMFGKRANVAPDANAASNQ